jgi:plastocyanin domain-containing protein
MNACRTASIAIVAFAMVELALAGCEKKESAAAPTAPKCPTCVVADARGFTPSTVTLPMGGPGSKANVTFTRTSDDTCARDVVITDLGVKEPLPLNTPVKIDIPTDVARTLSFQCGMAMYKSSLIVK